MPIDLSGVAFIFTTGVLALLSPCGFPMLPGYISYYLGTKSSAKDALPSAAACILGLLTVFSVIGTLVSMLGVVISRYILFLEVVAGVVVIIMGISAIAETYPRLVVRLGAPKQTGLVGIFLYGAIYGLATIGCSAPIFFSVIFYAFAAGGVFLSMLTFMVYAAGMGLPLIVITILVAEAKDQLLKRLVDITPWFQKVSGVVLIIVGVYLLYFYYTTS